MGLTCDIKANNKEYIERKEMCGVNENEFDATCSSFLDNKGRLPHIEEIPGANSHDALVKELGVDSHGYTSSEDIIHATGKETLREQTQELNNKYTDREIELSQTPSGRIRVIDSPRPAIYGKPEGDPYVKPKYTEREAGMALDNICNRISKIYGVNVHLVSTAAIEEMGVYDAIRAKGFVKDGEIFINSDLASIDTPVHELMHMIMGTLKAHNLDMYNKLCDMTTKMYDIVKMQAEYPGRTRRDVQEELFVADAARFIVGMECDINKLNKSDFSEFAYLFNRSVDTIINGRISVNNGNLKNLIQSGASFGDIANVFKSRILDGNSNGVIDENAARMHRINSNKKEDLIKRGILKEICD